LTRRVAWFAKGIICDVGPPGRQHGLTFEVQLNPEAGCELFILVAASTQRYVAALPLARARTLGRPSIELISLAGAHVAESAQHPPNGSRARQYPRGRLVPEGVPKSG
jgi:hypothetical protein